MIRWPVIPARPSSFWAPFALCLLVGCASDSGPKRRPITNAAVNTDAINELNLLAVPVALNFDQIPGPDGFVLKVYAGNRKQPKPIAIVGGSLEVLMFDGILNLSKPVSHQPRRIWTIPAEQLKNYQVTTSIGAGYELSLRWGDVVPVKDRITVTARYTSPAGERVSSAPSIISVSGK
jgi:hypothetical protein